jgi:hypothetical protein
MISEKCHGENPEKYLLFGTRYFCPWKKNTKDRNLKNKGAHGQRPLGSPEKNLLA